MVFRFFGSLTFLFGSLLWAVLSVILLMVPFAGPCLWLLATALTARIAYQRAEGKRASRFPAYIAGLAFLAAGFPLYVLLANTQAAPSISSGTIESALVLAVTWLAALLHLNSDAGAGMVQPPAEPVLSDDEREAREDEREESIEEVFDAIASALPDHLPRRRVIQDGQGLLTWRKRDYRAGLRVYPEMHGKGAWVFFGKAWMHVGSGGEAIALLRDILEGEVVEVIGLRGGREVDRRLAPADDMGHGVNHYDRDHRIVEVPVIDRIEVRRWPQ